MSAAKQTDEREPNQCQTVTSSCPQLHSHTRWPAHLALKYKRTNFFFLKQFWRGPKIRFFQLFFETRRFIENLDTRGDEHLQVLSNDTWTARTAPFEARSRQPILCGSAFQRYLDGGQRTAPFDARSCQPILCVKLITQKSGGFSTLSKNKPRGLTWNQFSFSTLSSGKFAETKSICKWLPPRVSSFWRKLLVWGKIEKSWFFRLQKNA